MGDKTDREHRLHPVTVGEWQRRGFRAVICRIRGATAAHSIRTNRRCRYDGLMFDYARGQLATRGPFSGSTDVEHQP